MSLNNPLANVLSFIQNYENLGKKDLVTRDNSSVIRTVLEIMHLEGYLGTYEVIKNNQGNSLKINLLGNINKTNVIRPNFQIKTNQFEKFEKRYLPAKNFGILLVSTSQGIMSHIQAKEKHIGGKLLAYCY